MEQFSLQIVTPDGVSFSGEAERLIVRTIEGDVCILANHVQYLTALGTGTAKVTVGGETRRAACAGGMLAVTRSAEGASQVRLVATTFEWAEDIDAARAQRAKARAEELLHGELSVALGIPFHEVPAYIESVIGKPGKRTKKAAPAAEASSAEEKE